MSDFEFWNELSKIFSAVLAYQQKTIEFNKRFVNPWIGLGSVFDKTDNNAETAIAHRKAIEIDPDNAANFQALGDVYFKMGLFDEAASVYAHAIELNPRSGWSYANLALVHATRQRYPEAIDLYLKCLELMTNQKDRAMIWNRLGNAYRKINEYDAAFKAFRMADECAGENAGFQDPLDEETIEQAMRAAGTHDFAGDGVAILPSHMPEGTDEIPPEDVIDDAVDLNKVVKVQKSSLEEPLHDVEERSSLESLSGESTITESTAVEADSAVAIEPVGGEELPSEVQQLPSGEKAREGAVVETMIEALHSEEVLFETPSRETVEFQAGAVEETTTELESTTGEVSNETMITSVLAYEYETLAALSALEPAGIRVVEKGQLVPIRADEAMEVPLPAEEQNVDLPVDPAIVISAESQVLDAEARSEIWVDAGEEVNPVAEAVVQSQEEVEANEPLESVPENNIDDKGIREAEAQSNKSIIQEITSLAGGDGSKEVAYEEFLKQAIEPPAGMAGDEPDVEPYSFNGEFKVEPDSKNAHVWNELGNLYFDTGAPEEAIAAYTRAIELDVRFAWPYSNLALAYVQKEKYNEAVLLYQRSIELFTTDKDKAVTWNRLGNVYRRLNDYNNAIASYQRADELDPNNTTRSLRSRFSPLGNLNMEQLPNLTM